QGFAAGTNHIGHALSEIWPKLGDLIHDGFGCVIAAPVAAVSADKIRIAKITDCRGAILLTPGPEVALAETAEHRRTPRMGALALQAIEHFLDPVHNSLRQFRRAAGQRRR